MVFSANEDGNTTTLLDFGENGDDDGSCKTISKFNNTIFAYLCEFIFLSCTIPFAFVIIYSRK